MAKPNIADAEGARPEGLTAFESKLVNLLALLLVHERQQNEQIGLLGRAGFRPAEIAALLGTTSNTVRVELSKQRRGKKRNKSTKRRKA